jgi:hypothetical protein
VVYLKRHIVVIGNYGEVIREYGTRSGLVFITIKHKTGAQSERIYDRLGLRSVTWSRPNEIGVVRFVRPDLRPIVYDTPDIPKRTPRLAGPKGHIPG